MRFPAKASADFTPVPAGTHLAICNAVIDLGLQKGSELYPDPKPQVYVRFELPDERIQYQRGGKDVEGPMTIGRTFTASMSKKANLRSFIENFFAKKFTSDDKASDFDTTQLIGHHCLLTVTQVERGERTYSNIAGVAPLPKNMQKNTQGMENEPLAYDLTAPDEAVFDALPKWLKEKIEARIVETPTREQGGHTTKRAKVWVSPPKKEEGDPGPFEDDVLPESF